MSTKCTHGSRQALVYELWICLYMDNMNMTETLPTFNRVNLFYLTSNWPVSVLLDMLQVR